MDLGPTSREAATPRGDPGQRNLHQCLYLSRYLGDLSVRPCTILEKGLASRAGIPDAAADLVVPLGGPAEAIASILPGNPLAEDWLASLDVPGERLVCWSGTLAEELFADEPRTWMRPGHAALEEFCDSVAPALKADSRRMLLRPHARHVLSDPQGSLDFLRKHEGDPFGLAVSPCDLLLPEMLEQLEEHLERILGILAPRAEILFLEDARPTEDGQAMEYAPIGKGVLPQELTRDILLGGMPQQVPLVVRASESRDALAWLGIDG